MQQDASEVEAREAEAQALNEQGVDFVQQRRYEDALAPFERAATLIPYDIVVQMNLGLVYRRLQNWGGALKAYTQAAQISPLHKNAHYYLGMSYRYAKRYAEAIREEEIVLGMDPEDHDAYVELGKIYIEMRSIGQAVEMFEYALRINRDTPEAHTYLYMLYLCDDRYGTREQAMEHLRISIDLNLELHSLWTKDFHSPFDSQTYIPTREEPRVSPTSVARPAKQSSGSGCAGAALLLGIFILVVTMTLR